MARLWLLVIGYVMICGTSWAASKTAFPKDWKTWTVVKTPLATVGGALPSCDADISKLKVPEIYVQTIATYCNVRKQGPGKTRVLVKPDQLAKYQMRAGKFTNGTNLILHLEELKVLFVTGYEGDKIHYGVYTEEGKDITAKAGPLAVKTCVMCHTGYKAYCQGGQCGRVVK